VNYELPNVPEDYVHRIGRTARAGQDGHAISLVSHDEQKLLADIERLLKMEINQVFLEGYEPQDWSHASLNPTGQTGTRKNRTRQKSGSKKKATKKTGRRPSASRGGTADKPPRKRRRRRRAKAV